MAASAQSQDPWGLDRSERALRGARIKRGARLVGLAYAQRGPRLVLEGLLPVHAQDRKLYRSSRRLAHGDYGQRYRPRT